MWVELTAKISSDELEHNKVEQGILINLDNVNVIYSAYDTEDRGEKTYIFFGDGRSHVIVEELYEDIKNLIKERKAVDYV